MLKRFYALVGLLGVAVISLAVAVNPPLMSKAGAVTEGMVSMPITGGRVTFSIGGNGDPAANGYLLATGAGRIRITVNDPPGIYLGGESPLLGFQAYRMEPGTIEIDLDAGQELWGMLLYSDSPSVYVDWMLVP